MPTSPKEDPRVTRLTKICAALPEVTRETHGSHTSFLVRKKVFVYYMDNHHGDGIVSVSCKVFPGDNTALVAAQPQRSAVEIQRRPATAILSFNRNSWEPVRLRKERRRCTKAQ